MSKHLLSCAILAVLSSLGACAQFDSEDVADESTAIEWPTSQSERIWVDGRSLVDGTQAGQLASGEGACACTSAECFDAWVADAFGCDVCVSFVCDGETVAHSCVACSGDPLQQGEEWNGDGRFE